MGGEPARTKKFAFLVPRPGLSDADFRRHWRTRHGPLVARAPGYAAWRHRYVQNHVRETGVLGRPFAWAGMAEFWLPAANEDEYALSSTYRDHVRPDELAFIDMDRTVSMTARETVIRKGAGGVKLVVLARRAAALTPEAYASAMAARAGAAVRQLGPDVEGCALDLVLEGSTRLPGARTVGDVALSSLLTLRFARRETLAARLSDRSLAAAFGLADAELHDPDATMSFVAEEIVFFADGRPTDASGD